MSQKFKLTTVLRARRAVEDVAKGAVLAARADVAEADVEISRRERVLADSAVSGSGNALAVAASLAARQSLAAGLAAAHQMRRLSEEVVDQRVADLAGKAQARRTVEKLEERHTAMVRAHELGVEQLAVDELSMTGHQRRYAGGMN
jgi:flagellar export protein FliJ